MAEKKTKSVPFRMTVERHRQLLHVLADRGQGFQDLLEEGLGLLLDGGYAKGQNTTSKNIFHSDVNQEYNETDPEFQRWIDALVKVLKSNHAGALQLVTTCLESCLELAHVYAEENSAETESRRTPTTRKGRSGKVGEQSRRGA